MECSIGVFWCSDSVLFLSFYMISTYSIRFGFSAALCVLY